MKTMILIIVGMVGTVSILATILHTETLGENATYGECLITVSSINGFMSSAGMSQSEYQCKEDCLWQGNTDSNEKQNISCKFQTISGYGWVATPEEFEYMIDKLSLNPVR